MTTPGLTPSLTPAAAWVLDLGSYSPLLCYLLALALMHAYVWLEKRVQRSLEVWFDDLHARWWRSKEPRTMWHRVSDQTTYAERVSDSVQRKERGWMRARGVRGQDSFLFSARRVLIPLRRWSCARVLVLLLAQALCCYLAYRSSPLSPLRTASRSASSLTGE